METSKINVELEGLSGIMFDRFVGQDSSLSPEQRFYLAEGNKVVLPAENLQAFFFGENPKGCAKFFEGRKGDSYIAIGQSHIYIEPLLIPFLDEKGKEIQFREFDNKKFYLFESSPRTKKGNLSVKQPPKKRPVLNIPWHLRFTVTLIKDLVGIDIKVDEQKIYNWLERGGILIGLGTYRPRFGRFRVKNFDVN